MSSLLAMEAPDRKGGLLVLVVLSAVLFLPSAVRFVGGASSLTAGLALACGLIIIMGLVGVYRLEGGRYWSATLTAITVMVLLVIAQGAIASLWFPMDVGRAAGSLPVVAAMMIAAYLIWSILQRTSGLALDRTINWMSGLFLLIALFSITGIEPASFGFVKPIFPFSEPSHYALSFVPFLIYQCVRSTLRWKIAWLIVALAIAYLLESLSLVVAVAVAALCSLSGPLLVAGLVAAAIVVANLDISYFTDRLDFGVNSSNVSTLVYIQGIELIDASVRETHGWGIGFQQLGFTPLNVPTTELIYRILRDDANLRDGGFLAAKLIAEMGYIGMILIAIYSYVAVRAALALRASSNDRGRSSQHELFALSIIVALSIEIFVRGIGYFSGTMLLLTTALLMLAPSGYFTRWLMIDIDRSAR